MRKQKRSWPKRAWPDSADVRRLLYVRKRKCAAFIERIDFEFPAFCWHNYRIFLARVTLSCEDYRDGAEKAKSILWQAQEEIQDRDPKDGSAWGQKKKIPQACA